MPTRSFPKTLYKYRAFNVNTLRMLTEAEVYYADPTEFNDPLDSSPSIQIDTDTASLEDLLNRMLIQVSGEQNALRVLREHRYMTTQYGDIMVDPVAKDYYTRRLADNVLVLLRKEIGTRGILSLAEKWNCPLMWSHYADHHRGLCIGYDMTDHACDELQPVDYHKARSVKVSELIKWKVERSASTEQTILETYFLAKAPQWRYEREWRDVSNQIGPSSAPARISAVHFGLRCDPSVITTTVELHARVDHPVKFYFVQADENTFRLRRRPVDVDEIKENGLRSSALLEFRDVFTL